MSNETVFVDGMIAKAPNAGAPDYVKARLSIRREELIEWLQGQKADWINVEVKESKGGKWYAAVDPWKPERPGEASSSAPPRERPVPAAAAPTTADAFQDDDIPF